MELFPYLFNFNRLFAPAPEYGEHHISEATGEKPDVSKKIRDIHGLSVWRLYLGYDATGFRWDGQPIKLEPRVYEGPVYLVRHRHRLVTKGELLESVWAAEAVQEGSLVRCISAARRALGDSTRPQPYIVTHYGVAIASRPM